MSKKKSKKKGRSGKFRPPVPMAAPQGSTASPKALNQARTGGDQATVRAVEMSLGARNVVTKTRTGRVLIESPDPAIPLDRVPYFTSDLVRLGVVGAAMFALLIVGSLAIPVLLK